MTRTAGSSNVKKFEDREKVSTTGSQEIKHLAATVDGTALDQFKALLRHQQNYLNWIETRHSDLNDAKKELAHMKGESCRGPKDSTYRKYKWYAEHSILLEAINGLEVFYKQTLINLGKTIRWYVPPENLGGAVDAKILWGLSRASIPELIFEHQLYHDLDNIDKACNALIGAKRYNKKSPKPNLKNRIKSLQTIFQIRHTLSHNHGVVTVSDKSKLEILGYSANVKEVIDPSKDDLRKSIVKVLTDEATDFTSWLLDSTADYLKKQNTDRGMELKQKTKDRLEKMLGKSQKLDGLNWV